MTEDQYLILRQTTFLYISADKSVGKEVKFENINSYIERGTSLFPGLCDDEVKKRLFTDIEYQFKITHAKGNVIFDNYDDERNWYSNDNVKEPFFWSLYKSLLYSL